MSKKDILSMGLDNPWIETYSGEKFFPLNPSLSKISILDISHSLSHIARFNGHSKHFYSVSQHSINVMMELRYLGCSRKSQLAGLFHDGSEAYLSDLVTPVKKEIKQYKEIEKRLQNEIWNFLGLEITQDIEEEVNTVDKALLQLEASQMMNCFHWKIDDSYIVSRFKENKESCSHIDFEQRDFIFFREKFIEEAMKLI